MLTYTADDVTPSLQTRSTCVDHKPKRFGFNRRVSPAVPVFLSKNQFRAAGSHTSRTVPSVRGGRVASNTNSCSSTSLSHDLTQQRRVVGVLCKTARWDEATDTNPVKVEARVHDVEIRVVLSC